MRATSNYVRWHSASRRLEDARRAIASRVGRIRDTKQDREFWNFLDADYAVGTPFSP